MGVENTGDTVETETVKVVLLHVESQIGQQESQDLVMAVVEQPRVPQLVTTLSTLVEVEVVATVKLVQPVQNVLASVRVNDIEQDGDAHSVRGVDQLLQLLGGSISAGSREERSDLVAERCIVCVLLDRHQLDDVVSEPLDSRQDVRGELLVCADLVLGRADTDVGFVDTGALGLRGTGVLEDVFLGVPESCVVYWTDGQILRDILDPCGQPVDVSHIGGIQRDLYRFVVSTCASSLRECMVRRTS